MDKYNIILEETWLDYPSKDGNAVLVYMTGCEHHCPGCHSPLLQKVCEYSQTNDEIINNIKIYAKRADTNKIVLLGGDPLYASNITLTKAILNALSNEYDICIFTGYTIEKVKELQLKGAKYYKCGVFLNNLRRESKKTDTCYILASSNQNFYDSNYNQLSIDGILTF